MEIEKDVNDASIVHSKSNYYLIAGLLVIVGILFLVAICVCIMSFRRLLSVFQKHDTVDSPNENATELQEIEPLTVTVDNNRTLNNGPSNDLPTYQEIHSTRV